MKLAPTLLIVVLAGVVGGTAWWLLRDAAPNALAPIETAGDGTRMHAPEGLAPAAGGELVAPQATKTEQSLGGGEAGEPDAVDPIGPPGSIVGRILDPEGNPVPGAEVELVRGPAAAISVASLWTRLNLVVRTDNVGKFRVPSVAPNDDYILVASHAEFGQCEAGPIVVPSGTEVAAGDLRLRVGVFIAGHVRCDGRPIENAVVILSNAMERFRRLRPNLPDVPDFEPLELRTATDAEGRYEFACAPFESFEITAEKEGYSRITRSSQVGFFGRSSREHEIDFDLTPAKRITGSVVDSERRPIAGAKVTATIANQSFRCELDAATDGAGRFAIEQLADGQYFVQATCDGFSETHQQQVAAGTEDLVIEMRVQGSALGVVVDEETGAPVTEFSLSIQQQYKGRGPIRTRENLRFSDASGRFEVRNLDPGLYVLEGRAAGYADTASAEFEVARGEVATGVRIGMNRGGSVTGIVVDRDGKPVKGALVMLRENGTKDNQVLEIFAQIGAKAGATPKVRTKEDGRFLLELVVPDTYQVAVKHQKYATSSQDDVVVRKSEVNDVGEIVVLRGARISGYAYDLDGNPLPGATITAVSAQAAGYKSTRSNADGFYELPNLAAAEYGISINSFQTNPPMNPLAGLAWAKNSKQTVNVVDGDDVTVNLRLSKDSKKPQ